VVLEEESGESESETSKTPKKTIGAVRKSTAKTKKKLMSWQSKKFQPPQCDIQEMPLKLRANELGLTTTSAPINFFSGCFVMTNFMIKFVRRQTL